MKICRFSFVILIFFTGFLEGALSVKVASEVALLVNADTGAILYEKNSNELCHPASITKIATALYAAHLQKDWTEVIEVPSEAIGSISPEAKKRANYKKPAYWVEVGSNHIGLKKGERLSFQNLMAGMMVASANDAANVIAYHLSHGDIDAFTKGMNEYLKELGCKKTKFYNPHGLHMPQHQTTAKDMAIMARAYLKNARLKEIGAAPIHTIEETNKQEKRVLPNGNKLLRKGKYFYPKAIGLKTGYTSDAKSTLVAAAEEGDRCLIVVLMRCEEASDRFVDAKNLFEAAFAEEKVTRTLLKKETKVVKKKLAKNENALEAVPEKEICLSFYPSEEPQLYEKVIWENNLSPEIKAGQKVAHITWTNAEGQMVLKAPLVAEASYSPSLYDKWGSLLNCSESKETLSCKNKVLLLFGALLFLGGLIFAFRTIKRKTNTNK